MAMAQALLPEFDLEMAGVRRTLERVPEEKFEWRPHPKSGTMGWLASHLATSSNAVPAPTSTASSKASAAPRVSTVMLSA